jgi:hypothetical protein
MLSLVIGIACRLQADFIVPHVVSFLKEQGRMKFVRPLYRDLFGWSAQEPVIS